MARLRAAGLAIVLALGAPTLAHSQATTLTLKNVMAGESSSGQNQTWLRADSFEGGPVAACQYQSWVLFYAPSNSSVSPEQVEAIALTALTTNAPVSIFYVVETLPSDFYGMGITRCRILRISLNR